MIPPVPVFVTHAAITLLQFNQYRYGLSALLIGAAILKTTGDDAIARLHAVEVFVISAEALLALWLFLGIRNAAAWFVAICLFSLFLGYSTTHYLVGSNDCGCFGDASLHPSLAIVLDAAIVVLLVCTPPSSHYAAQ